LNDNFDSQNPFLSRIEYTNSFRVDDFSGTQAVYYWLVENNNPWFSDSFIDQDDAIIIGGSVSFVGEEYEWGPAYSMTRFCYPVILKIMVLDNNEMELLYERVTYDVPLTIWDPSLSSSDSLLDEKINTRVKMSRGQRSNFYLEILDYLHEDFLGMERSRNEMCLYNYSESTILLNVCWYENPFYQNALIQDPRNSGCVYQWNVDGEDFMFYQPSGFSIPKILRVGFAQQFLMSSGYACSYRPPISFIVSYSKPPFGIIIPMEFSWFEFFIKSRKFSFFFKFFNIYKYMYGFQKASISSILKLKKHPTSKNTGMNEELDAIILVLARIVRGETILIEERAIFTKLVGIVAKLQGVKNTRLLVLRDEEISYIKDVIERGKFKVKNEEKAKLLEIMNFLEIMKNYNAYEEEIMENGIYKLINQKREILIRITGLRNNFDVKIELERGIPCFAEKFIPAWPLITYNFTMNSGEMKDRMMEIRFNISDIVPLKNPRSLRILQWDGLHYKDITTKVNVKQNYISGTTDTLSSFVLMNCIFSSAPKK